MDEFNCSDGISLPIWFFEQMDGTAASELVSLVDQWKAPKRVRDHTKNVPMLVRISCNLKSPSEKQPDRLVERLCHLAQI